MVCKLQGRCCGTWFKICERALLQGNGALPKDCRIIFFHGKPRPREVSEDWLPLISSFLSENQNNIALIIPYF